MQDSLDILGYKDYKISKNGYVLGKKGKPLKNEGKHEPYVRLENDITNERDILKISELVLHYFIGPKSFPESIPVYKNGNRNDRRAENLEWSSDISKKKEKNKR